MPDASNQRATNALSVDARLAESLATNRIDSLDGEVLDRRGYELVHSARCQRRTLAVKRIRRSGILCSGRRRQMTVQEVDPDGGAVARNAKRIGAIRPEQNLGTVMQTRTRTTTYKRNYGCYLSFELLRSTPENWAVAHTKPRRCVI